MFGMFPWDNCSSTAALEQWRSKWVDSVDRVDNTQGPRASRGPPTKMNAKHNH